MCVCVCVHVHIFETKRLGTISTSVSTKWECSRTQRLLGRVIGSNGVIAGCEVFNCNDIIITGVHSTGLTGV